MTTTPAPAHLDELAAACRGTVLRPADDGYDQARHSWNAAVDNRPAVLVRCADTADIATGVDFARRHGLAVSVRAGGHDVAGHPEVADSLMLDLSRLQGLTVDATARRATVGPGVTWVQFDRACVAKGLAVTGADVSTVGVVGTALSGGTGWLQRAFGFTCDNVRSAQVVLADGRTVTADAERHPELLWALRGGGGNFGVVTALELELHPVPTVYAGTLLYPYRKARDVLAGFREFADSAPPELSLRATLIHWPPGAPEGPPRAAVTASYLGSADRARTVLEQLRRIGEPELDLMRPVTYPELQRNTEQAFATGHATATGTEWLRTLDDVTLDSLVDLGARMPTRHSLLSIHQLGGAIRRMPSAATSFGFHEAAYHLVAFSGGPAGIDLGRSREWIAETTTAVAACSAGGPYIGILDGTATSDRVRSAYNPDTYRRLARIKATYDADNLFRCNHNIPPEHDDTPAER
ncbi:FAD-binding oxidoreductase [Nocardia mexicana]|uniref:FAD/FMN-containing dehydrogenase n=1 Tax=Nocardia mexicana TaxID=279262 RepID=A0A370H8H1_9NOCA|nr:FAD-binding oxidoreductase [Nocardia mexicana]RDI52706.1 FAD/FMN-containing dehydrogenase [Nocardia mexicana]